MRIIIMIIVLGIPILSQSWGFFAHRKINRLAVFILPPEMIRFYKENIQYITDKAINPDMRRYVIKAEAPRHYIDVDVYGDSAVYKMPRYWDDAVTKYSEDTLQAYGIVPYHINLISYLLIKAFQEKDTRQILRLSSDMGHYVADAHVPLHTTVNYNGQLTNQYGIHGLWESRLPELFAEDYDFFLGKAQYIENIQLYAWNAVINAHEKVDSVLLFEKQLTKRYSEIEKYGYEERGQSTVRTYSYDFSKEYHKKLNGMVERCMRASIKMVGNLWFSCWVKAGQPDLNDLISKDHQTDSTYIKNSNGKFRNHESEIDNK